MNFLTDLALGVCMIFCGLLFVCLPMIVGLKTDYIFFGILGSTSAAFGLLIAMDLYSKRNKDD